MTDSILPAADPRRIAACLAACEGLPTEQLEAMVEATPALDWSLTLCAGEKVTFEEAEKAVATLGDGWRLPTRREWCDIIDDTRYYPALDPAKHPGVGFGYHWTSTPCPWAPESAVFVVDAGHGVVSDFDRSFECFVRAVRAVDEVN